MYSHREHLMYVCIFIYYYEVLCNYCVLTIQKNAIKRHHKMGERVLFEILLEEASQDVSSVS